jgi:predicted ATPase
MIRFLSLTNFKCFDYLELEFAPLTLITGINGVGKSTIIQSLLLLRQSHDWRFLEENKAFVNGELVNLVSGSDIRYKWEEKNPEVKIEIEFSDGSESSWTLSTELGSDEIPIKSSALSGPVFGQNLFRYTFSYLYSERPGPRLGGYSLMGNFRHKGRLGTRFGELAPALFFNVRSEKINIFISELKHPYCEDYTVFNNVNAWLSFIFSTKIDVRPKQKSSVEVDLEFFISNGDKAPLSIPAVHSAFGYSYLFPVVLGLLTAEPGSLFIVENPEAHLHPSAQTKIGKLLALASQNGVQIIVETHSDHLLNGIRLMVKGDELLGKVDQEKVLVHYFSSADIESSMVRSKKTIKIRTDGKLEAWPVGFFDEWERSLGQLIIS